MVNPKCQPQLTTFQGPTNGTLSHLRSCTIPDLFRSPLSPVLPTPPQGPQLKIKDQRKSPLGRVGSPSAYANGTSLQAREEKDERVEGIPLSSYCPERSLTSQQNSKNDLFLLCLLMTAAPRVRGCLAVMGIPKQTYQLLRSCCQHLTQEGLRSHRNGCSDPGP
ncbi:hypothetical protein CEXT_627241 [Caerostris extrusa]|uniref:Uncharacterized protein n=1 Tax=Caerostris extrusa TaxID=172846 RepID=A0AAV4QY65_CAEEX|nr:hypothetical protein CEXT_627241 [Caerostris extrusa]